MQNYHYMFNDVTANSVPKFLSLNHYPLYIIDHWKVVLHAYDTFYGAVMYHVLQ